MYKRLFYSLVFCLFTLSLSGQCNYYLTASSSKFSDGSEGDYYENDLDCSWLIEVDEDSVIVLSFSEFDIEYDYDFIEVYDGSDNTTPLITVLTGSAIPVSVTSSGNQMYIRFTSDDYQSNSNGWEASYSSMHNSLFVSGVECEDHVLNSTSESFTDGSGTNAYGVDLDCSWLIEAEEGNVIDLSFTSFDTEQGFDFLKVYDGGDDTTAILLGAFSGDEIPPLITSSGNKLFITFTSDEYVSRNGWEANYTAYNVQGTGCANTELTASSDTIEDGSGSSDYDNNLNCSWSINVEDDKLILLDFIQFDTESGADSLTIYDGEDENATIIGSFSGTEIPTKILSSSSQLYITFNTNASVTSTGWKLTYESVENEPIEGCGETVLTDGSGSFSDGSGILNYENDLSCSWLIEVDPDSLIVLTVSALNTEAGADYLKIYNGEDEDAPLYRSLSGNIEPVEIISSSNTLYITFTTNESVQEEGWSIEYQSIENIPYTGCGNSSLTDDSGTFTDGSGSSKYDNNLSCSWTITVDEDSVVQLSFSEFDVEQGYDYVKIYDGLDDESDLIASYTGSTLPPSVQSSGNSLYVVFETDEMTRSQGWTIEYSSTTKEEAVTCGSNVLDESEATFSDGSAFDDYQANLNCSWSIEVHPDSLVYLTFSEFNTELNFDYVRVYDGEDELSEMIGAYSGANIPSDIISSSNHLYITFETDDENNKSGWEASYQTYYNALTNASNSGLFSDEMIKVHPNPFTDEVVIDINKAIPDLNIQLIDIRGNVILSQEVEENSLQLTLPLENLDKGVYVLVLSSGNSTSSLKLIK